MNQLLAESEEHHRKGFQLLSEGSYARAREQFLKAIEKNPGWAPPHLGLGQTFHFSPLLREVGFRLKSTGRRDIQPCPQPVTCAIMVEAATVGRSQLVAPPSPLFHGF